jgi:arsenate reductase
MAEGFLKSFNPSLEVYSAGTDPADKVHPKAVEVMKETGIDISKAYPKKVDFFLREQFDYVITVCDNARETCPVFSGSVRQKLHYSFRDPAEASGTEDEIIKEFRKVRDEIKERFSILYLNQLSMNNI